MYIEVWWLLVQSLLRSETVSLIVLLRRRENNLLITRNFWNDFSPILTIAKYEKKIYIDDSEVMACLTQADTGWSTAFFLLIISIFFLLPLGVLIGLYAVIARHLIADPGTSSSTDAGCNQRARKQVVLMLGTVVLAFFLCLLPFRILTLWIILSPSGSMKKMGVETYYGILNFCRIMHYLNSAVNPILYNLMSSKFRQGFRSLCGLRRRNRDLLLLRHTGTFTTTMSHSSTRAHPHRGSPDLSWRSCSIDSRAPICGGSRNGSIRRNVILTSSLLRRQATCSQIPNQPESYV